ncbi:MAG: hypothetical protein ACRD8U_09100, partial [Pyrinomonadaceae bacterium]
LGLLGVLVLSDPKEAEAEFIRLFKKADNNFDLTRCHDLVKTLEDRTALLTPELHAFRLQKRQYLNARYLFAADYYQTVFYYARSSVVKAFDALLKESGSASQKWIFQLYAAGGMGKTMFVRWLLARHCVPKSIPIARLDLDMVLLPTAQRHPWLLVLAIADQLNQQIPGSPFDEHLSSFLSYAPLLYQPGSGENSRVDRE